MITAEKSVLVGIKSTLFYHYTYHSLLSCLLHGFSLPRYETNAYPETETKTETESIVKDINYPVLNHGSGDEEADVCEELKDVVGHVSEDKRDSIEEPTEGCHEALTTSGPASLRDSILSDDEDIEPRSHSELIKEKVWTFL